MQSDRNSPLSGDSGPRIEVYHVPALDTGIGQEAGYESDAAFLEAVEAERAAMPPEVRVAVEQAEAELERRFLFGEQR